MRSSNKSRSRNNKNNNRNRNVGNVVNRVFDSAGPEGKVRGTPSQIIEKYAALARDAQLSGDRVAAENFQQHAEHYSRMLSEAQREQAERQAADARNRPQNQGNQQPSGGERGGNAGHNGGGGDNNPQQQPQPQADAGQPAIDPAAAEQPDVNFTPDSGAGPELVETPEAAAAEAAPAPKPERKPRSRSRRPAPKVEETADAAPVTEAPAD